MVQGILKMLLCLDFWVREIILDYLVGLNVIISFFMGKYWEGRFRGDNGGRNEDGVMEGEKDQFKILVYVFVVVNFEIGGLDI